MFNNTKTVYVGFTTDRDREDIKDATKKVLYSLGGNIRDTRHGFEIDQGSKGINFAFAADFHSTIDIKEKRPGSYEIGATVSYKPSMLTWLCFVLGWFFLWFLWFVPLVYFFINPTEAYQQALNRIESELE